MLTQDMLAYDNCRDFMTGEFLDVVINVDSMKLDKN